MGISFVMASKNSSFINIISNFLFIFFMDIRLPLKYINSRLETIYNNWFNFYVDSLKERLLKSQIEHVR